MILTKNRIVLPSGAPAFQTGDSAGSTLISDEGRKITYHTSTFNTACLSGFNFIITGSDTKLAKVTEVTVSWISAIAGNTVFAVFGRGSSAPIGGTSANASIALSDNNDPPPSALYKVYSVIPTTFVTTNFRCAGFGATAAGGGSTVTWRFDGPGVKPLLLRSSKDAVGLFFSAALGAYAFSATWTEE